MVILAGSLACGRPVCKGSAAFTRSPSALDGIEEARLGAVKWKYRSKRPMVSAVTATKGDVVFTDELTGDFLALDADDGKVLY